MPFPMFCRKRLSFRLSFSLLGRRAWSASKTGQKTATKKDRHTTERPTHLLLALAALGLRRRHLLARVRHHAHVVQVLQSVEARVRAELMCDATSVLFPSSFPSPTTHTPNPLSTDGPCRRRRAGPGPRRSPRSRPGPPAAPAAAAPCARGPVMSAVSVNKFIQSPTIVDSLQPI